MMPPIDIAIAVIVTIAVCSVYHLHRIRTVTAEYTKRLSYLEAQTQERINEVIRWYKRFLESHGIYLDRDRNERRDTGVNRSRPAA